MALCSDADGSRHEAPVPTSVVRRMLSCAFMGSLRVFCSVDNSGSIWGAVHVGGETLREDSFAPANFSEEKFAGKNFGIPTKLAHRGPHGDLRCHSVAMMRVCNVLFTKIKIFLPKSKSFYQNQNLFTKIKIKIFLPKSKSFYQNQNQNQNLFTKIKIFLLKSKSKSLYQNQNQNLFSKIKICHRYRYSNLQCKSQSIWNRHATSVWQGNWFKGHH